MGRHTLFFNFSVLPSSKSQTSLHKHSLTRAFAVCQSDKQALESQVIAHKILLFIFLRLIDINEISNNVVCATSEGSDQPEHMRSLIRAFASHLNIL